MFEIPFFSSEHGDQPLKNKQLSLPIKPEVYTEIHFQSDKGKYN